MLTAPKQNSGFHLPKTQSFAGCAACEVVVDQWSHYHYVPVSFALVGVVISSLFPSLSNAVVSQLKELLPLDT